jgi:hypothetical protein
MANRETTRRATLILVLNDAESRPSWGSDQAWLRRTCFELASDQGENFAIHVRAFSMDYIVFQCHRRLS